MGKRVKGEREEVEHLSIFSSPLTHFPSSPFTPEVLLRRLILIYYSLLQLAVTVRMRIDVSRKDAKKRKAEGVDCFFSSSFLCALA